MESVNVKEKRPKAVVDLLREEFNFGDKHDQSDKAVVQDFLEYVKDRGNEKLLLNEPSWADLMADELEKAGFAEPGMLSHETWSREHEQMLNAVLESLGKK
ncbi:MAG: hypothetical protein WAN61_04220 [Minisyncoccia bacterium]